jgi:hypothetical protein
VVGVTTDVDFEGPGLMAAVLIHESVHALGLDHVACEQGAFYDGEPCDATVDGAFGASAAYTLSWFRRLAPGVRPAGIDTCMDAYYERNLACAGINSFVVGAESLPACEDLDYDCDVGVWGEGLRYVTE